MKILRPSFILMLATAASAGAPAPGSLFNLIGPDYKKPREVPDTIFNPFKVEATNELMQRKGAAVTEQSVAAAVGRRGVSGVVYGADGRMNQVIIGDEIFRVGDELTFPAKDAGSFAPLVAGASVTLREVNDKTLVFEFAAEGEGTRRAIVSLRNFWRP